MPTTQSLKFLVLLLYFCSIVDISCVISIFYSTGGAAKYENNAGNSWRWILNAQHGIWNFSCYLHVYCTTMPGQYFCMKIMWQIGGFKYWVGNSRIWCHKLFWHDHLFFEKKSCVSYALDWIQVFFEAETHWPAYSFHSSCNWTLTQVHKNMIRFMQSYD